MSQYSETIGSFTRTGNYPLEANYIFQSEEALKQFYSDPIQKATLHEGLFKIVKTENEQFLYWVVNGENGLEFKKLDISQFEQPKKEPPQKTEFPSNSGNKESFGSRMSNLQNVSINHYINVIDACWKNGRGWYETTRK